MSFTKHVIIIPGLGNGIALHKLAVHTWTGKGVIPHVFDIRWKVEEHGFSEKLARALTLVDQLSECGSKIALIGNSAGSSFALNIFGARKKQISSVIVNCGRVRDGDWPWFTFNQATSKSPSFKESVLRAQKLEKTFTPVDRLKILTLRPLFDEVVPSFTVPIAGATNKTTILMGHSLSIALHMTVYKKQIIDFILNRAE